MVPIMLLGVPFCTYLKRRKYNRNSFRIHQDHADFNELIDEKI